jgi:hypothetical protein
VTRPRLGLTAFLAALALPAHAQDEPDIQLPSSTASSSAGHPGSATGGSRIDANARNVLTSATKGTAETEIGVGRSRTSSTDARNIVTTSHGQDAITRIGGGAGVVSARNVINEGGTLSIGANGITRDGMKCVEIYRSTCIIHFYYRRKHDPCLPGYWTDGLKCRLPSDDRHSIGR